MAIPSLKNLGRDESAELSQDRGGSPLDENSGGALRFGVMAFSLVHIAVLA